MFYFYDKIILINNSIFSKSFLYLKNNFNYEIINIKILIKN